MEDSAMINFSALEKELQAAVEADKKYRRENDAKFRAIHQNVGSYEEFRDIVQASHLMPLERKDRVGASRKQPWNPVASGGGKPSPTGGGIVQPSEFRPKAAPEFARNWRRFEGNADDRYHLLLALGGGGIQRVFRAELGAGLLGEFLMVLSEGLRAADARATVDLLGALSQTPRFGLALAFLTAEERGACASLMGRLCVILGDGTPGTDKGQPAESEGAGVGVGQDEDTTGWENILEKLKGLMPLYGVHTDSLK